MSDPLLYFTILLFYYFTIYDFTILLFYDFTILLFTISPFLRLRAFLSPLTRFYYFYKPHKGTNFLSNDERFKQVLRE